MNNSNILALDLGHKRIGLAVAGAAARLPAPLTTLVNDDQFLNKLKTIINQENIGLVVVGLPLNRQGSDSQQTTWVRQFVSSLEANLNVPITTHDETLSSKRAEEELLARRKSYDKVDIDALAATYILEDYLKTQPEVSS